MDFLDLMNGLSGWGEIPSCLRLISLMFTDDEVVQSLCDLKILAVVLIN